MKKAVIVTSEFGKDGGGLSKSCFEFSQLLQSIGYSVCLVLPFPSLGNEETKLLVNQGINIITNEIVIIPGGYKHSLFDSLSFIGYTKSVIYQLQSSQPDIVFAFGAGANGLLAYEISRHLSSKLVVLLRGSEINLSINNPELSYFNQKCLEDAVAVVGLSNELILNAKKIFSSKFTTYRVIPNFIEFQSPIQRDLRKNNIIFGTGARNLNEKKGIGNLIKTLFFLNNKGSHKYILRLAGDVDEDLLHNYKKLATELKVSEDVHFLGNMAEDVFKNEIASWDFLIQASICEGFSNTLANGLSIGKPFMMTNTSFIAEQIRNITPELILEDLHPEAIANKIHRVYFHQQFPNWVSDAIDYLRPLVAYSTVKNSWISLLNELKSSTSTPISNADHILSVILHDISPEKYSNVDMPQTEFEKLCTLVHHRGYKFCSAKYYFESPEKQNLIICTFDDAYQGVYDLAYPILKSFGFTATIFVCSDYIGQNNSWNKKDKQNREHLDVTGLRELYDNGWEIGSHGSNHISLLRLGTEDITGNLRSSKETLSQYFGEIISYAYPYGDYNYHISKLSQQYYRNIFAVDTGGTHISLDRHQIRRYTTDELTKLLNV